MTRITPTRRRSLFTRLVFWFARRILGRVPTPVRLVAHHGKVLAGQVAMERRLMKSHEMPAVLRSLAELRAATVVGCHFCMDIGSALGQRHGVTAEQVRDLANYATSPHFTDEQRDVLALADGMTRTTAVIPEAAFQRLRARHPEAAMVELLAVIAWENYLARLNQALGCEADGFSTGSVCALPARLAEPDAGRADAHRPVPAPAEAGRPALAT